jgi:hypothetical protein
MKIKQLNKKQKEMYRICLHGRNAYPKDVFQELSFLEKHKVEKMFKRSQIALNHLKQEKVNIWMNGFMKTFFPKTEATHVFTEVYGDSVDLNYICPMSFKDLNIDQWQIIEHLIRSEVLPSDYYELKNE